MDPGPTLPRRLRTEQSPPKLEPSLSGRGSRDHTPAGTQPDWPIATKTLLAPLIGFSRDAPSTMPLSDWPISWF